MILLSLRFWSVLVLFMPASALGPSQKPLAQMPATAKQLTEIKVEGSQRFPEADIAASTGLQIGQPVVEDDFKRASKNLADTGAFTDIQYSYSYSSAGTKLIFHVTDFGKFVPAKFHDFVWFSEAELRRRIKEHVPMFEGELPLAGNMADEVSDVLQAMLVEQGVPGHVDYLRTGKEDGPVESIDYRVSDVLIRIRNIKFTGAGEAEVPALEQAGRQMGDRQYSRSRLNLFVQKDLLPIYYSRGYLKASFGPPQPEPVKEPGVESDEGPRNQSVVDVIFAVTPGEQYKLKSLEWAGNHQFSTETLAKMVRAEVGQPANTVRIAEDLRGVQALYGSKGFLMAKISAQMQYHNDAATVAISLDVDEGAVYHMGDLEYRGLDNSLTAKLRNLWKLRPGDVYDATYLKDYLPQAEKLLPSNFDWEVSPHVTANVRDKSVDVDLIYSVKPTK